MSDEETPRASEDDSAEEGSTANRPEFTRARRRLRSMLEAMHRATGPDDAEYQRARDATRAESSRVAVVLSAELSATPERDYPTRIGLVQAASEIREPIMLPLLTETVLTPIPPEESEDPHGFSTVAEETIIRTTAVDGVAALARDGSDEAVEALFEFLQTSSFSVRRAAVTGLLAAPRGWEYRGQIVEALPKEQRFLADLKPTPTPQRVFQPDPEASLSESGRRSQTPPAPSLEGENPNPSAQAEQPPRGGSED